MTDFSTRSRAPAPPPRADDDPTTRGGVRWSHTIGPDGFAVWSTEVPVRVLDTGTAYPTTRAVTARVEVVEARDNLYPGTRGLAYKAVVAGWFTEGPFATLWAAQDAAIRAANRVSMTTDPSGVTVTRLGPQFRSPGVLVGELFGGLNPPESLAELRGRIGATVRHRLNVAVRGAVLQYLDTADGGTGTARPTPEHLARVRASLPSGRFRVTGPARD